MDYNQDVNIIKGIGDKAKVNLAKLGIHTIVELIEHYPKNYDVFEPIIPIHNLVEGNTVAIEAMVINTVEVKKIRNLNIINCNVKDATGIIKLTWFNMPFLKAKLRIGTKAIFRGKVVRKNGALVLEQPSILSEQEFYNKLNQLQPIYHVTSGITNNLLSKSMKQVLLDLDYPPDYLPLEIRKEFNLISYKKATKMIHFPKNKEQMILARRRIVFDEFFLFAMAMEQLKKQKFIETSNYIMKIPNECDTLIGQLSFSLTNAQMRVWEETKNDMSSGKIMNRLIQGDVGSGKTIIAALASLMAAQNGYQSTVMVPTEVLARQHVESLSALFEPFHVKVALLVGSMTAKEKKTVYELIATKQVDVIVGTHALIQEKVQYNNLALVITDEQHRFGVRQREMHSKKGDKPHILVMSATPIPRTLAIMLYGDLDLSIIDELPANRLPIKNCVVNTSYRDTAYRFIQKEVLAGRQAYIICSMVEEKEEIEAENVIEYTEKIRESLDSSIQIEYLHGKMKPSLKNSIMERYTKGEIQVLVSTTVIEVGVNVPNSTIMMIENAERFGLAQLHQLRGRVGRGKDQSYCILVNGSMSKESKERLEILNASNDGFFIASEDLKLRGPGDLFGIRQSGVMEFKMADIFQDANIMKEAYQATRYFSFEESNQLLKSNQLILNKVLSYSGETVL